MSKRSISEERGTGAGPWLFDNDSALPAGGSMYLDFPNMEYQGTKRFFVKHMPFDEAQITNADTGNPLRVTYNGLYEDIVVPNAVESFGNQGVTTIRVVNAGTTSIDAGDVSVAVKKEPYGADDMAREERTEPWAQRAANDIIPGGLPW